MGFTVKTGETRYGHYDTKEEAYDAIKNDLCKGVMPLPLPPAPNGVERFDWWSGVISVVPDPDAPP